jgi:predicted outer membrane protein
MTGTSFDRGYASLEVADHIQDIKDTSEEINSGTNASVRALAKQDLPMLKTHLKLSRQALAAG